MSHRNGSSDGALERQLLGWAEEFALVYELDLPRVAGKILGYLLVCDPPVRSQAELAETLTASRGAVSTMTRMLERFGWVERVSIAGQRQVGYRVRKDAWSAHVDVQLQRARNLYDVARKAQSLFEDQPAARRDRIDMTVAFADFWRQGMPRMLEQWNGQRAVDEDGHSRLKFSNY